MICLRTNPARAGTNSEFTNMETKNNPLIKDATLLDDFAGKAMQAMRSSEDVMNMFIEIKKPDENLYEVLARASYEIAQVMLKERTKHIKD